MGSRLGCCRPGCVAWRTTCPHRWSRATGSARSTRGVSEIAVRTGPGSSRRSLISRATSFFSNFYLKTTAFATVLKFSWIQESVANETVENRSKEKKRVGEFVCGWQLTLKSQKKWKKELPMVALVWSLSFGNEAKQVSAAHCKPSIFAPIIVLQDDDYCEQAGVMAVRRLPALLRCRFSTPLLCQKDSTLPNLFAPFLPEWEWRHNLSFI